MVKTMTKNGRQVATQTFNRFGVKKKIEFYPDSAAELQALASAYSGQVMRMTRKEYMENLLDYDQQ